MLRKLLSRRPSHATVVAYLALFVALGGGAYAASQLPNNSVGTKNLKDGAVTKPKIANGAVTGTKVNFSNFPAVPSARHADDASQLGGRAARSYALARTLHPTSAFLEHGWYNAGSYGVAGYAKDQFGIVHLFGSAYNNTTSGSTIFTLPVGDRPAYRVREVVTFGNGISEPFGLLEIDTDGTVSAYTGTKQIGLEGVTFSAGG
jgi:hypothetical protein